jgi:hypothetical protein
MSNEDCMQLSVEVELLVESINRIVFWLLQRNFFVAFELLRKVNKTLQASLDKMSKYKNGMSGEDRM